MKKWHMFRRIVGIGAKNLFRNSWLTIAAVAVMSVALIIIQLAVVLNVTANNAIKELSKNLKVSVYLHDDADVSLQRQLEGAIANNPFVSSVQYVSKADAQAKFTENYQNDDELIDGLSLVGGDAFPASLEVSVTDLSKMDEVEKIAQSDQYKSIVESITLGKTDARKTIDRAADAQSFITITSIVAAAAFTVVSALIIFNTIRMAIFTRSEEIKIMKLIGATPNYIRGPFLVEASIYGIIAGVIANSLVFSIIFSIGSKVSNQEEFKQTYLFFSETSVIIGALLASIFLGILIGVFSSTLAMEKHLKLKHW